MDVHLQRPHTLTEHFQAFTTAVDFSEPFVVCCLAFDCFFIITVLLSLCRPWLQRPVFFGALVLAWSLEWVNNLCANNWKILTKQNYFDKQGLFLTVMVGAPLLVGAILILLALTCSGVMLLFEWGKTIKAKGKHLDKQHDKTQ
mmetsp:Transcript_7760/g.14758  ORF Transcript_7760/g.14758 Transcript_7760/m.14758 type:complete len:144 (-) Transcript_7760:3240-3671(-)